MYDTLWPILQHYSEIMTGETIGTQIGCYSIAIAGLAIANRRIRPFSRFQKPSDIPKSFIQKRIELTGVVQSINANGGILMVQHVPVVRLSRSKVENLPVKLSGINVSGLGINWLQTIVAGNKIRFIPIKQDHNSIQCEVTMEQFTHENKFRTINVAESLVSVGFGNLLLDEVKKNKRAPYNNKLLYAEKMAQKKKMGLKFYLIPLQVILLNFLTYLFNNMKGTAQKLAISARKNVNNAMKITAN